MSAWPPYDPAGDVSRARYERQLALPEMGVEGQAKLARARVLIVGLGGLGSPVAFYLAAAGVGTLGLMDGDRVDASNLQRQVLHTTESIGQPKALSAATRLKALNPSIALCPIEARMTADKAPALLQSYDLVIEATDSFASKFVVAEACHAAGKPCVHGGIRAYGGQVLTVRPGETACYRCVFGEARDEEEPTRGPLGVVAGMLGMVQATEAIKHLLGIGKPLAGRLLVYDALAPSFRVVPVERAPACPLCGISS